ncbi:hypothetical protein SODALDRAFT_337017 [Sodiomyces alkalinus F11]|uniref:Protein BNI4 n=1 Tax=Sodiomyces alkalinus (strain CBS 110278 / VKM F-3762 / F11) TaxID=1314773 RepID=A0A3N2PME2_SODAK|nr:hypothetical protein SODALDRAFT_337017 [Sodiomyces alkalinus F11]ROT35683.1 hypothetical protein SODALDRAFT_337017 [Sodiomyces alkalinus F11]
MAASAAGFQNRSTSGTMLPVQAHPNQPYMAGQQGQRSFSGGMAGPAMYRGNGAPIQQYAFASTPNLHTNVPLQPYGGYRTTSSPVVPTAQHMMPVYDHRSRHMGGSMSSASYRGAMGVGATGSRDDLSLPQPRAMQPGPRPQSAYMSGAPMQMTFAQAAAMRPAPDRYRRPAGQTQQQPRYQVNNSGSGTAKAYDSQHAGEPPRQDRAPTPKNSDEKDPKSLRLVTSDNSSHVRQGSSESVSSSRSGHSQPSSSANRNVSTPTGHSSSTTGHSDAAASKQESSKSVTIPPRASSSDAAKRTVSPSPLSKEATMEGKSAMEKPPSSSGDAPQQSVNQSATASTDGTLNSPAAQQLAAINQNGGKSKSKTSRLRRAFSFGSAADFKKAADSTTGSDSIESSKHEPARLRKEPTGDELFDAEQAAIAKKQEESGLGNNIYGGRFFSGSTDNLSVSSTASSASIMIRKMGRGMKKSSRSLVGLFRPKSSLGVSVTNVAATEASQAEVSMITVEAERVNVNPNPRTQNGGGTGFPHLERNSLDMSNAPSMVSERGGSSGTENSSARKSIVGGDRERQEVLAAVRKGILKHRSGSPSSGVEKGSGPELPAIPRVSDSPNSSAPSTPNDEAHGHKRTGSVALGGEDYFVSAMKLRQDTKSAPTTPQGGKRNATFSPRIVFYDTWHSQEYDRRGEIATCNRLTPMLAQQIKEELNSFKMVSFDQRSSMCLSHGFNGWQD